MSVNEDANIIALAKVARDDSIEEKETNSELNAADENGQEQMKL